MEWNRSNPEDVLRQIQHQEEKEERGRLKIFFGFAAGVGKTYAMLEAAQAAKARGVDVVLGYVEPHARPETARLAEGLEQIPTKAVQHGGITLQEFDLDGAIARKPQLILVDELAHTNAPGSRHQKRYQDIKELLRHGIDVYTTVNVQHIESLNDLVASITGVTVQERIPDAVFDRADQVELVDLEPRDLMERLRDGKIYREGQAQRALGNFFTEQNLISLREIALRRCADRVNRVSMVQSPGTGGRGGEHILVCLSSSPSNARIIRTAARMAHAFQGRFTALFVRTSGFSSMEEEDKKRLNQNIHLARQLGAQIETANGEDIAFQIAAFARRFAVSQIVLGRSSSHRRLPFGQPSLTERITQLAPGLDIHVIPDQNLPRYRRMQRARAAEEGLSWKETAKTLAILLATTGLSLLFDRWGLHEANIITVYLLSVVLIAAVTNGRIYSITSSLVSVLLFNFLFTEPRYTLNAYDTNYPITFLVMFVAAFVTSSLTVQMKRQARLSAQQAFYTKLLFDTSNLLSSAETMEELVDITGNQLAKLLDKDVIFYTAEQQGDTMALSEPQIFPAWAQVCPLDEMDAYTSAHEHTVASWVLHNNKQAGATTGTLADGLCRYLSVRVGSDVFGVVGIAVGKEPLDTFSDSVLISILGECALAMQNRKVAQEREQAALLAKQEQLRANLLRSISHDLRTPLTAISGNAGMLLAEEAQLEPEKRRQLYTDIYDDALWLIHLVENLLFVTRIEDGTMQLRLTTELLEELISGALRHVNRRQKQAHHIVVQQAEEFLLVKADARLLMQVIINLVDNAIKYTPAGSEIVISTSREKDKVILTVADNGPGVSDEAKAHIFEMFYTANSTVADSRRSLGLGLSLCKSILMAHGGDITITDNKPQGAVFTVTLPAEEVVVHE